MAMPNRLVLIRHGESEANVIHSLVKRGQDHPTFKTIYERTDWQQRLSLAGIEQARKAGRWVERNSAAWRHLICGCARHFSGRVKPSLYVANPKLDSADAASIEAANREWVNDDRLVERNWGMYANTRRAEENLP